MQDHKIMGESPSSYNLMIEAAQVPIKSESRSESFAHSKRDLREYGYSADESNTNPNSYHTSSKRSEIVIKTLSSSGKQNPWTSLKEQANDKRFSNDVGSSDDERLQGQVTTIVSQGTVKFVNGLPTVVNRDKSTKFHCISCGCEGMTLVKYEYGDSLTTLLVIFCFVLLWPCMIYLMCSKRCKDIVHYCPRCNALIGKKRYVLSSGE